MGIPLYVLPLSCIFRLLSDCDFWPDLVSEIQVLISSDQCVSLWSNVNVPNAQDMVTGTPITSGLNTSVTDEICGGSSFVAPRLVFQVGR